MNFTPLQRGAAAPCAPLPKAAALGGLPAQPCCGNGLGSILQVASAPEMFIFLFQAMTESYRGLLPGQQDGEPHKEQLPCPAAGTGVTPEPCSDPQG